MLIVGYTLDVIRASVLVYHIIIITQTSVAMTPRDVVCVCVLTSGVINSLLVITH